MMNWLKNDITRLAEERMQLKSIYTLVFLFILFATTAAFGADETSVLPADWSNTLQASTRNMVQAGLDQEDALLMTRAMHQARFQEEQVVQAQHVVKAALEKDLPVEPVMNKAYEGMAKKVDPSLIVQAMERVRSRYEYAYGIGGQLSQQKRTMAQLGNTVAGGLAAGISRDDMEQVILQLRSNKGFRG